MIRPDEIDLMSFFESEPSSMDDPSTIPFEYNFSTYYFQTTDDRSVMFSICPSCSEVVITVKSGCDEMECKLNNVNKVLIIKDIKEWAEMHIESDNSKTQLLLKPTIKIKHIEERSS